jgi:hypothetical protein
VRHGGRDDPKRIAIARQKLIVWLEGCDAHPIKRKEQHEQEQAQWQVSLEKLGGGGVQIRHAAVVLGLINPTLETIPNFSASSILSQLLIPSV